MPTQLTPRLLSWASLLEDEAREQAERTSRLSFIEGHVALMPDAHFGLGATVGSVIPTRGAIMPAAVGVDIGCGMIAVETDLRAEQLPDSLDPLHSRIASVIPAGVGQGHEVASRHWTAWLNTEFGGRTRPDLTDKEASKASVQFGSLGSGNHFAEVCLDERDVVWVVLHSGSRGVGNMVAKRHIDGAKGLMKSYFIDLEDPDLAYLVEGTPEFDAYITAMLWCQEYAMENRAAMMEAALTELFDEVGIGSEVRRINCHHNFTEQEHHHGKNVWVTRKGAIRAREGDEGVIPGSMGAASYIVKGLGNPASFMSCSHGAGRRMSRGRARRELTADDLTERMEGRAWNRKDAKTLIDEHPDAYKDIDVVMNDQKDLVEIQHTLHQVVNYKGT